MVDDNSVVNFGGIVKEQLFGKTHRFSDCRWEKSQASNQNLISLNIVVDPRGVGQQHSSSRGIPTLFQSRPQLRFCPHPVELLSSPGRRQLPTCPPAMSRPLPGPRLQLLLFYSYPVFKVHRCNFSQLFLGGWMNRFFIWEMSDIVLLLFVSSLRCLHPIHQFH